MGIGPFASAYSPTKQPGDEDVRRFGGREEGAFLSTVLSVDIERDESPILAGHENGTLILRDIALREVAQGAALRTLGLLGDIILDLEFSPDATTAISSVLDDAGGHRGGGR